MHTVTECAKLAVDRLATVNRHEAYAAVATELADLLGDLHR
jgi:hypothetical protein